MSLLNRVDPFGAIHAVPERGMFMGNRGGCFHRDDQTLKARHWSSQRWIICVLSFKDGRRKLMQPGLYTELFFLDEATALAGGHRPCFECRRADAGAFREALVCLGRMPTKERISTLDEQVAGEIQKVLKGEQARETVDPATLPDSAMYAVGQAAWLKHAGSARRWGFAGYGPAQPIHTSGQRLTPRLTCEALGAGYRPVLHSSVYA